MAEFPPQRIVARAVNGDLREMEGRYELESYTAGQGQCVGRDEIVSVSVDSNGVTVGGNCVTCVEGTLSL